MKDRKAASRCKRGLMVINLIETPSGYSIIEGTELLNKVQSQISSNNHVSQSQSTSNPCQPPSTTQKQQPKMTIKQNNLYLLKKPNSFTEGQSKLERTQKKSIPKLNTSYAEWFNFSEVSEIQKNQLKCWVFEHHCGKIQNNDPTFLSWVEKYRKHRNIIIEVYYAHYALSQSYMSASTVRRYICDDANWLMKIHMFLTNWGIINASKINFDNERLKTSNIFELQPLGEYGVVNLKPHSLSSKNKQMSETERFKALRKVTQNIRPYCDYCGIHCQMIWFQHMRSMDPKQISVIMRNVNSKNPPLSEKEYQIILCTKCFCNGSFPLLLTHHDFRKVSVNDRLEPGKRRKTNKNKRKEKKIKNKEKQLFEYEQEYRWYKEEGEEGEDDGNRKEKQESQNENEQEKDETVNRDRKLNGVIPNGTKEVKNNGTENIAIVSESQRLININEVIQQIVKMVKKDRVWSFSENLSFLQLIEKHNNDFDTIYKSLLKLGHCSDCEPQDIIAHFLQMPLQQVSELTLQNSPQTFVNENRCQSKSDFFTKKVQRNFDNFVKVREELKKRPINHQNHQKDNWKTLINKFVEIYTHKVINKVEMLTKLQQQTVSEQRKYEEATKEIAIE